METKIKRLFLFFLFVQWCSCAQLFDEKKTLLTKYSLDSTTVIEIRTVGYGATTNDVTEIVKHDRSKSVIVKRINNSYAGFKSEIFRINDTVFKVVFTDTAIFKGHSKSFDFNIDSVAN